MKQNSDNLPLLRNAEKLEQAQERGLSDSTSSQYYIHAAITPALKY